MTKTIYIAVRRFIFSLSLVLLALLASCTVNVPAGSPGQSTTVPITNAPRMATARAHKPTVKAVVKAPVKPIPTRVVHVVPPPFPGHYFHPGDSSPTIKVFQDQMHARGFFPVGTGDYGPNTLAMVTRLQAQNGLTPNGEIGPNTWKLAWTGTYKPPSGGPVATYISPVAVVQNFYSALNRKDFQTAWSLGGYNFTNGGDYYSWVAGYRDTNGVTGTATDIGGGVVATSFSAVHDDGSVTTYSGTYTVRDGIIISGKMVKI